MSEISPPPPTPTPAIPTGVILPYGGDIPPDGWLLCDGSALNTADYPDLFAVIGYKFGGSGATFNLPDLRGKFPRGVATGESIGDIGGEDEHVLTADEIPSHTHSATVSTDGEHSHPYGCSVVAAAYGDMAGYNRKEGDEDGHRTTLSAGAHTHTVTIGSTGGGLAHNNIPPYQNVNYIIKT